MQDHQEQHRDPPGPSEWFTGAVHVDAIAAPKPDDWPTLIAWLGSMVTEFLEAPMPESTL